ncbi:2-C-methyl-D-erythritol 4-phosphate cytidylyltransferase [Vibrio sp. TH_r3]|uniref:2-C-methyl-D-erythritol 4-phosphate cytidylyltransferase n=1 Tax=Vibrio sp. TH_r3 TaxID=3082084 RepID=UPI00295508F1|nr:2-C-methyl-D-erythritol 4-phosphate cytidylyltransferase [Vibrio sp. TH_r3]MDV7105185.1 2-C-methyl-D-erythritol 4-phosphate cytidylyltransferase [Vibrio sp. TH_r3]
MQINNKFYAIVPAAGIGRRMKTDCPKQYLQLHNKTILQHTVDKLLAHPLIDKVIVAISEGDEYFPELSLASNNNVIRVVGGQERADSVLSGLNYVLKHINQPQSWVLVHDAARPCVRLSDIDKLITEVVQTNIGGILAAPVRDTMKRGNGQDVIHETVNRVDLWHALTPQMFRAQPLYDALSLALEAKINITDEASAMEWTGVKPKLVVGRADNFKITQPEDLALAAFYLSENSI